MSAANHTQIADAINERLREYYPDGAVRFGVEEAVMAIAEVLSDRDPGFSAIQFKSRCFRQPPPEDSVMGYTMGEDVRPSRGRGLREWNR